MPGNDSPDAANRHAKAARKCCFGMAFTQAEQQLVILAAAKRQFEIVTHNRAIRWRKWNRRRFYLCANATALQHVTEVLPKPVADIDRRG